jgi:tetratricopeptide (TPR) repeat protein
MIIINKKERYYMKKIIIFVLTFILILNCAEKKELNNFSSIDEMLNWTMIYLDSHIDSLNKVGLDLLKQAKIQDSTNERILYIEPYSLCMQHKLDEAIEKIKKNIDRSKNPSEIYNLWGKILDKLGDTVSAKNKYQKALTIYDSLNITKGKEFVSANYKSYLIFRLYGKDSALRYYEYIKSKYKIFDENNSVKEGLMKYNIDSARMKFFEKK